MEEDDVPKVGQRLIWRSYTDPNHTRIYYFTRVNDNGYWAVHLTYEAAKRGEHVGAATPVVFTKVQRYVDAKGERHVY